jgi:hypothetical protein
MRASEFSANHCRPCHQRQRLDIRTIHGPTRSSRGRLVGGGGAGRRRERFREQPEPGVIRRLRRRADWDGDSGRLGCLRKSRYALVFIGARVAPSQIDRHRFPQPA